MATRRGLRKKIAFETGKFRASLKKIVGDLKLSPGDVEQVMDISMVKLHSTIRNRTPVDTGAARASWLPPDKKKTSKGVKYRLVSSGVSYIILLEFGSSKQAPQGMVRISLREFRSQLPLLVQSIKNRFGGT